MRGLEKVELEKYDYREKEKLTNHLLVEVEELSNAQRIEACEAIRKIKTEVEEKQIQEHTEWFDKTVLPILKELAMNFFAELSVEREERGVINVSLRSSYGFDLQDSACRLRMLLFLAARILFSVEDKEAVLVLTYDCHI